MSENGQEIISVNPLDNSIISMSVATLERLIKLGVNATTLYIFYATTAKEQSVRFQKNIVNVYATESFCMKGLGWGKTRLRETKKILVDERLVESIIRKDKTGKIVGHFVKINYIWKVNANLIPFDTLSPIENHTPLQPAGGFNQRVVFAASNTSNYNKNTNNLNTNTSSPPSAFVDNKDIDVFLNHFNLIYKKQYRASEAIKAPLAYWLTVYSMDEIKKAITNSATDEWWKDKLTPVILLRKMNPAREPVDYIGKFLNMDTITFDDTPLSPLKQWQIADEYDVNLEDVIEKEKAAQIASQKGWFPSKFKNDSIESAVREWIAAGVNGGSIKHLNEGERMQLDNQHPDQIEFRKKVWEEARKAGDIE